jgi:monoterpene epsilon-lactone hydrolase
MNERMVLSSGHADRPAIRANEARPDKEKPTSAFAFRQSTSTLIPAQNGNRDRPCAGPVREEIAMVLHRIVVVVSTFAVSATAVLAQNVSTDQGREIPAYTLPVPEDISPEMRPLVAAAPAPWDIHPKSIAEWKELVTKVAAPAKTLLPAMREKLGVKLEQATIGGVNVFVLTPQTIAPENQNRVFIHFHGGAYVLNPGEPGTREGTLMAGFGRAKVISVDYRTSSDAPYPAALDDSVAVYRELLKTVPPQRIAVFGTSTGGALTMALVLRARQEGLPLPAAIAPGSPWSDMTKTGDTFYSHNMVDNFQVSYDGYLKDSAYLYANGRDLKDPMLSPIYGDLKGFPPTILISGTRDLFLSLTVRTHRKLRRAGVEADLQVFEGLSHAQYTINPGAPETLEAFEEIARFFDRHMQR